MSAGKKVRGPQTPKSVEPKGPVSQVSGKPSAPNMSNKNRGSSSPKVSRSESESATNEGFKGKAHDPKIKNEVSSGHIRNSGSALRGGPSRTSSHKSGNRYGA